MAESAPPPAPAGLQLDHAEYELQAPAQITCAQCQRAITDQYYEAGGHTVCEHCRRQIELALNSGSPLGRFALATSFGVVAGAVGSAIYYAVRELTGYEVGLISIAVGFMVGTGVRRGSAGRGGWPYQLLAVALTYLSIVSTYIPYALQALQAGEGSDATPAIVRVVVALLVAFVAPFLAGFQNIIGLLIIGFGMYQAWKMNTRVQMTFNGPFRVGAAAPPAPAASA